MKQLLLIGTGLLTAAAAGAGMAVGTVAAARGEMGGAPGISKALARIGGVIGGGMIAGMAVVAGASALIGLAVFEGVTHLDEVPVRRRRRR
jgi:hypothetical protein